MDELATASTSQRSIACVALLLNALRLFEVSRGPRLHLQSYKATKVHMYKVVKLQRYKVTQ